MFFFLFFQDINDLKCSAGGLILTESIHKLEKKHKWVDYLIYQEEGSNTEPRREKTTKLGK